MNHDKFDPEGKFSTELRHEIMLAVKANNVPNDGSIWLGLIFRTESELVQIAHALHIKIPSRA